MTLQFFYVSCLQSLRKQEKYIYGKHILERYDYRWRTVPTVLSFLAGIYSWFDTVVIEAKSSAYFFPFVDSSVKRHLSKYCTKKLTK